MKKKKSPWQVSVKGFTGKVQSMKSAPPHCVVLHKVILPVVLTGRPWTVHTHIHSSVIWLVLWLILGLELQADNFFPIIYFFFLCQDSTRRPVYLPAEMSHADRALHFPNWSLTGHHSRHFQAQEASEGYRLVPATRGVWNFL